MVFFLFFLFRRLNLKEKLAMIRKVLQLALVGTSNSSG